MAEIFENAMHTARPQHQFEGFEALAHGKGAPAWDGRLIDAVIQARVLPELRERYGLGPAPTVVRELADVLLHAGSQAAIGLILARYGDDVAPASLFTMVLEPVARLLGDLSEKAFCSEFELTVALGYLQSVARILGTRAAPRPLRGAMAPVVLVVAAPGEVHGLGAALDSEAMWGQGWAPHLAFPEDEAALEALVAETWFDVLDINLSVAVPHEELLPRMASGITRAREASCNKALVVTAGGRAFAEGAALPEADGVSKTAAGVADIVMRSVLARKKEEALL